MDDDVDRGPCGEGSGGGSGEVSEYTRGGHAAPVLQRVDEGTRGALEAEGVVNLPALGVRAVVSSGQSDAPERGLEAGQAAGAHVPLAPLERALARDASVGEHERQQGPSWRQKVRPSRFLIARLDGVDSRAVRGGGDYAERARRPLRPRTIMKEIARMMRKIPATWLLVSASPGPRYATDTAA